MVSLTVSWAGSACCPALRRCWSGCVSGCGPDCCCCCCRCCCYSWQRSAAARRWLRCSSFHLDKSRKKNLSWRNWNHCIVCVPPGTSHVTVYTRVCPDTWYTYPVTNRELAAMTVTCSISSSISAKRMSLERITWIQSAEFQFQGGHPELIPWSQCGTKCQIWSHSLLLFLTYGLE